MRLQRLCFLILPLLALPAYATSITLGSASSFGFLGGTLSNTGTSIVTGNVGAMITVSGFYPTGTAIGTVYPAPSNPTVTAAYNDVFGPTGTFITAAGLTPTGTFTNAMNQTFLGGNVYASTGTISTVTGTNLTFDAQNDSSALFIIQIDGTLTVNGSMTFDLINGAQADNIFWIIEGSTDPVAPADATISIGSTGAITFDGNIIAGDSFTMSAGSGGSGVLAGTINGCVFARNANTLAGQTNIGGCANTSAGGTGPTGGGGSVVPEPASMVLLGSGLMALAGFVRRKRRS